MSRRARPSFTGRFAGVAVGAWAAISLLAGASLMVSHWTVLPKPDVDDPAFTEQLNGLRTAQDDQQWVVVHVLYSRCSCSQRVFDHLFDEQRPAGAHERILLVEADPAIERRAAARGFSVKIVTRAELKNEFHIEAAPMLIVIDPQGSVRYAGGYTDRKQGFEFRDTAIVKALADGGDPAELPLFGCGVSEELQQALDPFRLKYG
ncbi:MAG: hypothetical protein JKY37_31990 [Nannocystaceae bacterium]|nr:hypothetical protein [Nannocystaceae bacterium]